MISHSHFAQELQELSRDESGWPAFPDPFLEGLASIDSHPSSFLSPYGTSFEDLSGSDTSSPPAFITQVMLEPFQCLDENMSLHFADPRFLETPHDSGQTTFVSNPAPGKFYSSGTAVNNNHSIPHISRVPNPLQNAIATCTAQESNNIAEIGATICSLVAAHLKELSGLSTTPAIATPLLAGNHTLSPPDTKICGRIRDDSQDQLPSHRFSKTAKVTNTGLFKNAKGKVTSSRKGRRGDFRCSHPGCTTKELSSRRNLLRHQENVHSTPMVLACGSVQKYRRDNFVRHLRKCQKCQESSS